VIDDIKTACTGWVIHARNIDQLGETANRIIAQKCQHIDNFGAARIERQLTKSNLCTIHRITQLGFDVSFEIFHHIICVRVRGH